MKKLTALALSLVLTCVLAISFAGCNTESKESKMMTLSLNPQIEFILDSEDKVVTVNALNDEGNYLIAKVNFVGMTADEAVNAFLKIAVEDGFLLEGEINAGENQLKISVSGDDAQKLYDEVKGKAEEYLETLKGVTINVNFDFSTISKEDLEALVEDCMRELNVEELKDKTQAELLKLLENSRQATEDLLSQELKDCYYAERALEIKKAQLDAYIEAVKAEDVIGVISIALDGLQSQLDNLMSMVSEYKTLYKEKFLDATSEYYQKMQECLTAKKELLQARLNDVSEEVLETLEATYQSAVSVLNSTKEFAQKQIKTLDTAINSLIDTVQTAVEKIAETAKITISDLDATIKQAVEETKNNFDQAFKDENGNYIANKYWANLDPTAQAE